MERKALAEKIYDNHIAFIDYIHSLTDEEFVCSQNDKWTPGQQLDHLVRCIKPLAQILPLKEVIVSKFGPVGRPSWSYEEWLRRYLLALEQGGKAPAPYVPEKVELDKKTALSTELKEHLNTLIQSLDRYTDAELDSLALPHPLLGKISILEMLYLMTFHTSHHHEKTIENLKDAKVY